MSHTQDFHTIVSYPYPHDAELVALRARLDDAGLDYYVMDHHFLSVVPFDTQAIGGVKVRVRGHQTGRAMTLLRELKAERPREIEPIDEEDAAWMAERAREGVARERYGRRLVRTLKISGGLLGSGLLVRLLLELVG
jgi:hypothetical protein